MEVLRYRDSQDLGWISVLMSQNVVSIDARWFQ